MNKNRTNKVRILIAVFAVALLAMLVVPSSYAYFTARDTAKTEYTFANIDTEIEELKSRSQNCSRPTLSKDQVSEIMETPVVW